MPKTDSKVGSFYPNYKKLKLLPPVKKFQQWGLDKKTLFVVTHGIFEGTVVALSHDDDTGAPFFFTSLNPNQPTIALFLKYLALLPEEGVLLPEKAKKKNEKWSHHIFYSHPSGCKIEKGKITLPGRATMTFEQFNCEYNKMRQVWRKLSALKNNHFFNSQNE